MNLRPYQLEAVDGLREGIRQNHRAQILMLPTGAGKTVVASHLIAEASAKLTKSLFICDRVQLVRQASTMFDAYGIGHGVLQADHWRARPWERVQVASAQTLAKRGFPEGIRLAVVDEAHTLYKTTTDFIERNPSIAIVGLTATPFTRGMGKFYTRVVNVTTTDRLIEGGYLSRLKAYAARLIDMTGAKLKFDGEWQDSEIEKRGLEIVGDVVQGWIEKTAHHFGGPVKTICFSATIAHGAELCRQFQAAGINFQQISYLDGNDEKRKALIDEFSKPNSEIIGLVSCEALSKGFDCADILCGISCRPYRKSLSGHIQQLGRVTRPAPGKAYALWLDHGGNYLRFAEDTARVFSEGISTLDNCDLDAKVRPEPKERETDSACKGCGYVLAAADIVCPSCGKERPRRQNTISHKPGELAEVSLTGKSTFKHPWMRDRDGVYRQICGYALDKKGGDIEAAGRFAYAQYRNMYGEKPRAWIEAVRPEPPSPEVVGYIRHQLIAWAKGRVKAAA